MRYLAFLVVLGRGRQLLMGELEMLLDHFLRPHRVFLGVGVLVALGIGYSVYSRAADPPQDNAASRSQVNTELSDVGRVVGRLNQSYAIPPVISGQAFTGGSYFIDTQDGGDGGMALNQAPRDDASASDAQAVGKATRIKLPPPLVIGDLCRPGCQLPCWLQGDIGWLYGELPGPVCVDIPRPVVVPRPVCGCPCQGHHPSHGCGCSCHGHHPYPQPHPHLHAAPQQEPQAEQPAELDELQQPGPEAGPPMPGDIQPRIPGRGAAIPAPRSEPVMPSVLKPAVPSNEQMLQEELRRLREEVEQLRDQLNRQRQASLLDLEA